MSYPKLILPPPFVVEITVISADGLKNSSSIFSLNRPFRPFLTLSTLADGDFLPSNPIYHFGDLFHIPLDVGFFPNRCFIFLRLFSKRLLFGPALIGWCRMPADDISQLPVGSVTRLSYRLRKRDGSRSRVIVNLTLKLVESLQAVVDSQVMEPCGTVIGMPVAAVKLRGSR
ncbi:BON1-associated protein 2-like [Cucumis melo var. makuwa]|nr:BON1-associated protein 2-like [Cucumis melo var. makuwa]